MIPELELLYNNALANRELVHWLKDEELIQEYRQNQSMSSEQQEELLAVLKGEELALFRRFLDSQLDWSEAECRMLFSQGFALGLRFGSLCAWC